MARTPANTLFGNDCAIFTVDTNLFVGLFTNVGLSIDTTAREASAVMDTLVYPGFGPTGYTLDFSRVVESTLPMMVLALSDDPTGEVILHHTLLGDKFTFNAAITSCRWEAGDGAQSSSVTMVSQGAITAAPATSTAPTPRAAPCASVYGQDIVEVTIGTVDMIDLFDSVSVDVSFPTLEAAAVLDTIRCPKLGRPTITVNASRLIESPALQGASLTWMNLNKARAQVNVAINTGAGTFTGTGIVTNSRLTLDDGAQKETVTVQCRTMAFA